MKNSVMPQIKAPFYIVESKPLFDDGRRSNVTKCDIASSKIKKLDLSEDESTLFINDKHEYKLAGKINHEVGDIIHDKEIAYEVMGKHIERNKKVAAQNLKEAQEEVEAMKNLSKFHEEQIAADKLGFDKKPQLRKIVDENK